ncbi:cytochrome P450 4c3-like [Schistocerca nitens]|uniref:cytochrome P450 4c3-like n=1 Tax=Schistocerca nitens TaxID=7011 RepID=UPI002118DCD0|nr:cytochrome P450 4c3-like [Schistocerca nitens]
MKSWMPNSSHWLLQFDISLLRSPVAIASKYHSPLQRLDNFTLMKLVRTFVLAASDSTATALSCIFALLGLHPEWQDAIQKEVDEIFGTGDDYLRPTIDSDLAQLKVTEAVIKRRLRLPEPAAPPADALPRPRKFDPRRFLEGGGAGTLFPYSYLPFGAGSRLCLGGRFAMLVMKTTLSMVMRQFRIVASCTREELEEIAVFIIGKPVRGIRIKCIPRSAPTMKN